MIFFHRLYATKLLTIIKNLFHSEKYNKVVWNAQSKEKVTRN